MLPPTHADAAGRLGCDVVEVRPSAGTVTRCDQLRGRTLLRMGDPARGEPADRQVCVVEKVPVGAGAGWYFDPAPSVPCPSPAQGRIAFSADAEPIVGVSLRLYRPKSVQLPPGAPSGACHALETCGTSGLGGPRFVCETRSWSCQLPCATDADCTTLPGFFCDTGLGDGLFSQPVCVNPACRSVAHPNACVGGVCEAPRPPGRDSARCAVPAHVRAMMGSRGIDAPPAPGGACRRAIRGTRSCRTHAATPVDWYCPLTGSCFRRT